MSEQIDCLVIGAGIAGLSVARALARAGREVIIAEAGEAPAAGITARNSGVIHAGLYYPPGSLKARLCVAGREALYAFCAQRGVPHQRCGKLLVANGRDELAALQRIAANARASGVTSLQWLEGAQLRTREPALRAEAALWSPETGIVDAHALSWAVLGEAEQHGAVLALRSPVTGGDVGGGGLRVSVGAEPPLELRCRVVVNAAGLSAPGVARSLRGLPDSCVPRQWLARGHYFSLSGKAPFGHLVYPVPQDGGLGVHFTLDTGGGGRFGPDVEWIQSEDYAVDPARADAFVQAVRRYWPDLPDDALQPAWAGIRPKLSGPGEAPADFMVQDRSAHGVPGLINLYGIESPGLTAALALGELVATMVAE